MRYPFWQYLIFNYSSAIKGFNILPSYSELPTSFVEDLWGANYLAVALFTKELRISCDMSKFINEVACCTTHGLCCWILPLCSRHYGRFCKTWDCLYGHIKVVQRRYSICRQLDDQLTLLQYYTNLPTGLCTGSTLENTRLYHRGKSGDLQYAHHHNYYV